MSSVPAGDVLTPRSKLEAQLNIIDRFPDTPNYLMYEAFFHRLDIHSLDVIEP